jgi:hypothetical protein
VLEIGAPPLTLGDMEEPAEVGAPKNPINAVIALECAASLQPIIRSTGPL